MLAELFTSKTRIKLLLKLFLNPEVSCYLRELANEFSVSPNSIKVELDSLSKAGYLTRERNGRSTHFKANQSHPFFPEISSIVRKTLGIDNLIEQIMTSLGNVDRVYILDDYAQGKDSGLIDLLIIGDINSEKLESIKSITEKKIKRTIRILQMSIEDFEQNKDTFLSRPHWKVI